MALNSNIYPLIRPWLLCASVGVRECSLSRSLLSAPHLHRPPPRAFAPLTHISITCETRAPNFKFIVQKQIRTKAITNKQAKGKKTRAGQHPTCHAPKFGIYTYIYAYMFIYIPMDIIN